MTRQNPAWSSIMTLLFTLLAACTAAPQTPAPAVDTGEAVQAPLADTGEAGDEAATTEAKTP